MIKRLRFLVTLGFFASSVALVRAEAPAGAAVAQPEEPLQMIIDYGNGRPPKRRESHDGVVEPVGLPIGQTVNITLKFLRKRAGEKIAISSLDGGMISLQQPPTIGTDGSVNFQFTPTLTPGLYRLQILGGTPYELSLYAFDPNAPPRPPRP